MGFLVHISEEYSAYFFNDFCLVLKFWAGAHCLSVLFSLLVSRGSLTATSRVTRLVIFLYQSYFPCALLCWWRDRKSKFFRVKDMVLKQFSSGKQIDLFTLTAFFIYNRWYFFFFNLATKTNGFLLLNWGKVTKFKCWQ